jgi:hypothetical protein
MYNTFNDNKMFFANMYDNISYLNNFSLTEETMREKVAGMSDDAFEEYVRQMNPEGQKILREIRASTRSSSSTSTSSPEFSEKPSVAKSVGRGLGVLGIAIPSMMATDAVLHGIGVENETTRNIASGAVGLGAGEGAVSGIEAMRGKAGWKDVLKRSGQGALVGGIATAAEAPIRAQVEKLPIENKDVKDLMTSAGSVAAAEGIISGGAAALGRIPWGRVLPAVGRSAGVWGIGLPLAIKGIEMATGKTLVPEQPEEESVFETLPGVRERKEKQRALDRDRERIRSEAQARREAEGAGLDPTKAEEVSKRIKEIRRRQY